MLLVTTTAYNPATHAKMHASCCVTWLFQGSLLGTAHNARLLAISILWLQRAQSAGRDSHAYVLGSRLLAS